MRLPQAERAFLDVGKIEDYRLNPTHLHGRHKARVFRDALGLNRADAVWLKAVLLRGIRDHDAVGLAADDYGTRWRVDVAVRRHDLNCGENHLDRANRRRFPAVRNLLGAVMATTQGEQPALLDAVALLSDLPSEGLARGQGGTVVEALDSAAVLVEFSDPHGRAYAIVPCPRSELLVLHQAPQTA